MEVRLLRGLSLCSAWDMRAGATACRHAGLCYLDHEAAPDAPEDLFGFRNVGSAANLSAAQEGMEVYSTHVDFKISRLHAKFGPCLRQGMEVYSTVLWHLKRDVELAHLAQEALARDRRSARAWAIAGQLLLAAKGGRRALTSLLWHR